MLGFLLAAVCGPAAAWETGEVPTAPVQAPQPSSARERLDAALGFYLAGDHDRARAALVDLLNDTTVTDAEIRIRARVYLGEVLFVQGDRDASWDAFWALLEDDSEHRLDPYEHPPDVVEFFETVQAARAGSRRTALPARPPARPPLLVYAPFGAWQIANRERRKGWALATIQLASGAASLWLLADLTESHETYDPDVYDTLLLERRVSWTVTAVFYGTWLVGSLDARSSARRAPGTAPTVGVGLLPGGGEVALTLPLP